MHCLHDVVFFVMLKKMLSTRKTRNPEKSQERLAELLLPKFNDWNLKSWWFPSSESPKIQGHLFRWTMLNFRGVFTICVSKIENCWVHHRSSKPLRLFFFGEGMDSPYLKISGVPWHGNDCHFGKPSKNCRESKTTHIAINQIFNLGLILGWI